MPEKQRLDMRLVHGPQRDRSGLPCILYIITLPSLGGAQSHVLELLKALGATWNVHLATSAEGPLTQAARRLHVPVHLLPSLARDISSRDDIAAIRECLLLIKSLQPTLVHAHSSKAGLVARIAARMARVPIVFTAHGWGFTPGTPILRRSMVWLCEALTAPLASAIICVSRHDQQLARRKLVCDTGRLFMVHNGITDVAPLASPATDNPPRIIMVARFSEPKDQQLLLRAFAAVHSSCDARLVFVGNGSHLPHCKSLAQHLGVAGRVEFLGARTDVPHLLASASIFALTTRYEGLPICILEAMRAGLPVIASDVGGIGEEVEHGSTGILVPPNDMAATTKALQALIDDPSLRGRMGVAGRHKFLAEFTLDRMVAQTATIYSQIIHSHSAHCL